MTNQIGNYTYETDEKFGNGGFGLVYLARKEGEKDGEKKLYVIKIPLENKMDPDKIFNFNNEIDILNILSKISGNIYTSILYGFKKFENVSCIRPYYVMDYFSRGTLLDYIFSGHLGGRFLCHCEPVRTKQSSLSNNFFNFLLSIHRVNLTCS